MSQGGEGAERVHHRGHGGPEEEVVGGEEAVTWHPVLLAGRQEQVDVLSLLEWRWGGGVDDGDESRVQLRHHPTQHDPILQVLLQRPPFVCNQPFVHKMKWLIDFCLECVCERGVRRIWHGQVNVNEKEIVS